MNTFKSREMEKWLGGIVPIVERGVLAASILVSLILNSSVDAGTWPGSNGRIAYESEGEVWSVNPDGTDARKLADGWNPSYSPDGNWIAYTSERENDIDLYVIRADGTGEKQVTNNTAVDEYMPSWYDNDTLIFKAGGFEHTDPSDRQIVTVDIGETPTATYSPIRGPQEPGDNSLANPERSSLGGLTFTEWYFIAVNKLKSGIWTASGAGTPTLVSTAGQAANNSGWSPDGQRVVYSEVPVDNRYDTDIFTNSAGGGAPLNVTNTSSRYESAPRYSPDGTRIVFSAADALYIIDASGGNEFKVVGGFFDAINPDWGIIPGTAWVPTPPTPPDVGDNPDTALIKAVYTTKIKKLKKQFKKAKSSGNTAKAKKIKAQIKKFKKKLTSL